MDKRKLIVIDGNSLLFRAYYATAYGGPDTIMRTSKGVPTNAIFGFSNMLLKLLSSFEGNESLFVGFDADSHTFRKEEFEQYKANRPPCPEDLIPQFASSRELLESLNVKFYEEHGIEADDICGTIAKEGAEKGYEVKIYTSDKDYLQLVDDNITVILLKKGLSVVDEVTPSSMVEEFGFAPKQIIDFKGLRGDSSDNLPGIPGVGDKTAVKLIQEYGSFDEIVLAAKDGRIKGKIAQNIIDNEELGRTCLRLAKILIDAKLPFDVDDCLYPGCDFKKISDFCHKYELRQLLNRLPSNIKAEPKIKSPETKTVSSLKDLITSKRIGVSFDIDSSSYHDEDPHGIAISDGKNNYYIHTEDAKTDEALKTILEDPCIEKDVFDGKKCLLSAKRLGIDIKGIAFDMMLASYILDSSVSDKPKDAFALFGIDIAPKEENISLFDPSESSLNGNIAYFSFSLREKALSKLKEEGSLKLYEEIELPLMGVLAKMESEGFPLHGDELQEIGKDFYAKKDYFEKRCHELAGRFFNVGSPKQVGELLFDELHLGKNKKKGTSVEVLKDIIDEHPIVEAILQYRKYAKLCSTYIEGLLPHIKSDGCIHSVFHQAETSTGRLSSSNPNLQNISTRDEESKAIRKAFHYDDGSLILSLDYGQIELRLLAALASCKPYIDVFASNRDVHAETARKIFGIPDGEEVPHERRRQAKAINFAIIYGTSAYGLSEQIGCSPKEAGAMIASFYESYPEISSYLSNIVSEATKDGYCVTMFGRKRHLRDLSDPVYVKREAARRAAMNAPIQGSAADLLKKAMIEVDKFLSSSSYKTKMVLTIHDELLFKVPPEEIEEVSKKIREIMENAVSLPVKLVAEGSYGASWFEAKE